MKNVHVEKYRQSVSANKEKVTKLAIARRVPPKFIDPTEGRRRISRQEEEGTSFSIKRSSLESREPLRSVQYAEKLFFFFFFFKKLLE